MNSSGDDPGGSGSARDHRIGGTLLRDTSQFLTARPTPSRICQFLVFHTSWPARPWSAALAQCSEDGVLHLVGAFGIGRELVDAYQLMPLYGDAPLIEAVTTAGPVIYVGNSDLSRRYPGVVEDLRTEPGFSDEMTLIDVPLNSFAGPIGSIGIFFEGTATPVKNLVSAMEDVAALLTVYFEAKPIALHSEEASVGQRELFVPRTAPENQISVASLTKRQLQVLGLMAQRLSNHEIADALGYSESTVRMDATAIYRALGVNGRREAVAVARASGLVA